MAVIWPRMPLDFTIISWVLDLRGADGEPVPLGVAMEGPDALPADGDVAQMPRTLLFGKLATSQPGAMQVQLA